MHRLKNVLDSNRLPLLLFFLHFSKPYFFARSQFDFSVTSMKILPRDLNFFIMDI